MNDLATKERETALATESDNPYAAYGEAAASGGKTFLKFSKGEYTKGSNEDEVDAGTEFAANMEDLSVGWIRWEDKRPVERRMGSLASGFVPAKRDELGHTDQDEWPVDKDGKPQDPWQLTNELPLADTETGEQLLFVTSSRGGIGAIGNLCKAYGAEFRQHEGETPIVSFGVDSYKHTDYGKVYVPQLEITSWVSPDGAGSAATEPDADTDEDEDKPKAAPKKGTAKTRF